MSDESELVPRVEVPKRAVQIPTTKFNRLLNSALKRTLDDARQFPPRVPHVTKHATFNELGQRVIPLLAKLVTDISYVETPRRCVATYNDAGLRATTYPMLVLAHQLLRGLAANPNNFPPGLPPLDIDLERQGFWLAQKEDLQPTCCVSTTRKADTWLTATLELGSLVMNRTVQTRYADYNWGRSKERVELQDVGYLVRFPWHVRVLGSFEDEALAVHVAILKQPRHRDNVAGFNQHNTEVRMYYSAYDDDNKIQSWRVDTNFNVLHETEILIAVAAMGLGWSDMRLFLDLYDFPAGQVPDDAEMSEEEEAY